VGVSTLYPYPDTPLPSQLNSKPQIQVVGELGLINAFSATRTATIEAYYDCEVAT